MFDMKKSLTVCDVCGKEEYNSGVVFSDWYELQWSMNTLKTIKRKADICSVECLKKKVEELKDGKHER